MAALVKGFGPSSASFGCSVIKVEITANPRKHSMQISVTDSGVSKAALLPARTSSL